MERRAYTYRTITQVRYILDNYAEMTNREIAERLGITREGVRTVLRRRGIKKQRSYGFRKGSEPHNKGKKMAADTYAKVQRTMFKPGNLPAGTKPIGARRISSDGYHEIKIAHPNHWTSIQRHVWAQHHGPIPAGYIVLFRPDADRANPTPDQLECIPRSQLIVRNNIFRR